MVMSLLSYSGVLGFNALWLYFGFVCDDFGNGNETEAGLLKPSTENQLEYSCMGLSFASAELFLQVFVINAYPLPWYLLSLMDFIFR